jgi:hypothetical protein
LHARPGVARELIEQLVRQGDPKSCWTDWPYARRWGDQPTVSYVNPVTGKRWNGPARTLGWFLLHGTWPRELTANCATYACWNPHHAHIPRLNGEQNVLALVPDHVLLTEVERRGLLPRNQTNA